MMIALPDNNPNKEKFKREKSAMLDELASEKAYMSIIDTHVRENGSAKLGDMLKVYDNMK